MASEVSQTDEELVVDLITTFLRETIARSELEEWAQSSVENFLCDFKMLMTTKDDKHISVLRRRIKNTLVTLYKEGLERG